MILKLRFDYIKKIKNNFEVEEEKNKIIIEKYYDVDGVIIRRGSMK